MTTVNGVTPEMMAQYNQYFANYINGVDPNAEHGESISSLAMNIGLMGGITAGVTAASPYWGKYKAVRELMARRPGMTFTQAWGMTASNPFLGNAKLNFHLSPYESMIPKTPETAKLGPNAKQNWINKSRKAGCYSRVKALIEEARAKKMTGAQLKAQLQKVEQEMVRANRRVFALQKAGIIKPTTRLGKIGASIRKYSGYNKLRGAALHSRHAAKYLKGLRYLKGGLKGSGIMAAAALLFEAPDIVGAFKIDSKSGWKQVGKSTVKTVASIGGYAAGSALAGAAVGALAGTAVCPVIGTIVGVVGGLIGGWLCSKAADKIVGEKSVVEEQQEKQAQQMAQAANESPEAQAELIQSAGAAAQKLGDEEMLAMLNEYSQVIGAVEEQYPETTEGITTKDIFGIDLSQN